MVLGLTNYRSGKKDDGLTRLHLTGYVLTDLSIWPDGAIYVKWVLYKMRVGFPIDHFIVLFRKVIKLPNGETGYSGFQYVVVPGHLDEYQVSGLDSHSNYMFVVYGVHEPPQVRPSEAIFTGGLNDRKITQFSQEVFVPAETTEPNVVGLSPPSQPSDDTSPTKPRLFDMNSTSSNSLMFLILGVLAGFMLTVMLALVAVCFCRQHREKLRLLAQMNSNTKVIASPLVSLAAGMVSLVRPPHAWEWGAPHSAAFAVCVDQPTTYDVPGGMDDQPQPKTDEGAGKADLRLLVSFQPHHHHRHQPPGFLLSDLTPLAVANFRTATLLTGSAEPGRRPHAPSFHSSSTNSPSRANGEVCSGDGGRGDEHQHHQQQQQQPMSLAASFNGTTVTSGGAFPSENTKLPPRPDDLECTRSLASSCASNRTDSACSSFPPDPPAEAKREPPSGGSIHDESDDDENAGAALPMTPTKGLSTAFFTQMPFGLPAYPTVNTFECPSFFDSRHSLSVAAPSHTTFSGGVGGGGGAGGGRRFSPIIGRRSKLLSPLMEPYPEIGGARIDGQVMTHHGCRRTAAVLSGLRPSDEDHALPLLQLPPRPRRRAAAPMADVELPVSRCQSPTTTAAATTSAGAVAAALRIQAIVPNEPMCCSAGSRRSRSPTAYFPGLRITRCSDLSPAVLVGSSKEADAAASIPQSLPSSTRFQIAPALGLAPAMQSSGAVRSLSDHRNSDSSVRPYQADAATQTGPLPAYPTDASRYSIPPDSVRLLDQPVSSDRDLNNSRSVRTSEDSLPPGPTGLSGSECFDGVFVTAANCSSAIPSPAYSAPSQTDFVASFDQLQNSPPALNTGCPTEDACSPTDCAGGISASEPSVQSQPFPPPRPSP
ncbi:unnamed protein product [Schistocephalus solidus]|uniref:Protein kinase domain-containing protein n=1 Tax=Schistocephalus solidus TaxID=70667 RepID=A0A183SY34_SCHSO|nr:unnamed protein product [Schistocephalus solidus]